MNIVESLSEPETALRRRLIPWRKFKRHGEKAKALFYLLFIALLLGIATGAFR